VLRIQGGTNKVDRAKGTHIADRQQPACRQGYAHAPCRESLRTMRDIATLRTLRMQCLKAHLDEA
jgi:hypothetical protein